MVKLSINLCLYLSTHFVFGFVLNTIGPIIPYLSELTTHNQSDYSFLFILRGISFIVIGILHKTLFHHLDLHFKMLMSCLITGLGMILFSLTLDIFYQAIFMVITSLGSGSIEILIQICLLKIGGENTKQTVTLSYTFFSLGMTSGPILIIFLHLQSFFWIGIFLLICSFGFWFNKTPSNQKKEDKVNEMEDLPDKFQFKICLLAFLLCSVTFPLRYWLPSFAVVLQLSSKQFASFALSAYSTSLIAFRLLTFCFHADIAKTLRVNLLFMLFNTIFSLFLYMLNLGKTMILASAILYGINFSVYFPYLLSLPSKYNMKFSLKVGSSLVIMYAVSEAIAAAVVGYLMMLIHPIMLYFSILLAVLGNIYVMNSLLEEIQSFYLEKKNELNLQLLQK